MEHLIERATLPLVDDRWRYVSDAKNRHLKTTGIVHLADCPVNPHARLREIAPDDVLLRRCQNCERREAKR